MFCKFFVTVILLKIYGSMAIMRLIIYHLCEFFTLLSTKFVKFFVFDFMTKMTGNLSFTSFTVNFSTFIVCTFYYHLYSSFWV